MRTNNNCTFIGRLTRDAELGHTQSSVAYCRFTLAVDRPKNQNGEKVADFIPCIAWRGTAELLANYTSKGDRIAVCGSLQSGAYTDNTGKNITTYDVMVDSVELLEPKKDTEQSNETDAASGMKKVAEATRPQANDFEVNEDDLPF